MTIWAVIGTVLSIAWTLFQTLYGNAQAKAAATKALQDQFALLEAQGEPVLRNIVQNMGRTSFDDWASIPAPIQPPISEEKP